MPEAPHDHTAFWMDFLGRIGAPIFAATLVACLLSEAFEVIHGVLMGLGVVLMGMHHWFVFHRHRH